MHVLILQKGVRRGLNPKSRPKAPNLRAFLAKMSAKTCNAVGHCQDSAPRK